MTPSGGARSPVARIGALPTGYARALIVLLIIAAFAILPTAYGDYLPQQITGYLVFGLLALSVALVAGFARLLNLGVGATFGVSAYAVAIATQHHIFNPFLLFAAAIGCGLLVSGLFGVYSIVASGIQYMMLTFLTTLAFFSLPLALPKVMGGDNGLTVKGDLGVSFGLNPLLGNEFYWFVLAITALCAVLSWYVLDSQAGKAVRAMGRNPVRAAAMGYQVSTYRVALTLFSGFIASIAGWLYVLQNAFVFQDLLGIQNSLNGLLYALIGGVDTIVGPLLGAGGLRFFIESVSRHSTQSSLYIGAALLLVVYFLPEGVLGLVRRGWRRLQAARGGAVAAVTEEEADTAAAEAAFVGFEADDQRAL
ncbi:MAG TPA: branched-chain amino acid ABC transporter permease [Dehalococcoidia bacterium]|nr:branched-chain amino acid ABC transporter permease [Dehalococcoidia bacterium]